MKLSSIFGRWRRRSWIISGTAVVILAAGSVYWFDFGRAAGAATAVASSTTVAASVQTLEKTVSASGTLSPSSQSAVSFLASGTVTAVNVTAGSTVTAGAVLATVDTLTENAKFLKAKATLAAAQAQLSSAEVSSTGTASNLAQIAADKAAVSMAAAGVTSAQTEYNGTTLVAPVAGLVTAVNTAVGDTISSGGASAGSATTGSAPSTGTSTSSTADFTIIGTSSWNVAVSFGASDLKNVKVGQQVALSTAENSSFFGTVTSIGLLPTTTTGAATYPVAITVTGSPTDLYDGVTATAKVIYEKRTDVLTVPSAAVTTANGVSTVEKVASGKTVKTTVTVGETVGNLTEITKGLSTGDQVAETRFTPGTGNTSGTRGNPPGGTGGPKGGPGGGTGGGVGGPAGGANNG